MNWYMTIKKKFIQNEFEPTFVECVSCMSRFIRAGHVCMAHLLSAKIMILLSQTSLWNTSEFCSELGAPWPNNLVPHQSHCISNVRQWYAYLAFYNNLVIMLTYEYFHRVCII